ncbi:helix-hairpin-helix domain-containing protein [Nocardioides abyssi]|uniref:Helix-hairpin-helix domain-containing protein n=1 Tax=Nocardioides abyssi TaxID=3058370 RepID=A0ABT8EXQ6_9ACTN|nr:helix-hairpin-helix domain-containing protein [Nocardioides abyssi]MDN4162834.1 helix-hairpin-helix domain-containing protein [Nocardioides abyssi]
MRSRRAAAEHQEAVTRRLALLSAELAAQRPPGEPVAPDPWWSEPLPHDDGPEDDWTSGHTRVRRPPAAVRVQSAHQPAPTPVASPVAEPPTPSTPRAAPRAAPAPRSSATAAPPVPEPGRHAARRSVRIVPSAAGLVPETLRGRAALGSAQLTVVAVVVALGLAVTCWWVVRSDAGAPVAPAPVDTSPVADLVEVPSASSLAAPGAPPGSAGADPSGAASGAAAEVVVDVAGKVRRPGIVVLDAGARVVDALDAAGGARPGVDLSSLNLARLLVDGEQVLVGRVAGAPPPATGSAAAPAAPGAPAALVDLNRATTVELEALPEVGPVTAAAILAWRDEHGGFRAVDELLEVDGIGEATLGQIRPFVTVGGG